MSDLVVRRPEGGGYLSIIEDHPNLKYIRFGVLSLARGQGWSTNGTGEYETCLVALKGRVDMACEEGCWSGVGGREDVFSGRASSVFVGRGGGFEVEASDGAALVAVCQARARKRYPALHIPPEQVKVKTVGRDVYEREVHDILVQGDVADRLLVGETFNQQGRWSSYPPHKHDMEQPPVECSLEEIYYYQVKPDGGFGIQALYDGAGLDQACLVRDGDTVVIHCGYHPAVAAPGYRLYYLWVLAGERRAMTPSDDPAHAWVKEARA